MKRLISIVLLVFFISSNSFAAYAVAPTIMVGQSCTKSQIGKTKTIGKKNYVCAKSGKSGIWKPLSGGVSSNTTATTVATTTTTTIPNCLQSGPCIVGSKGPGGGIVFYDAGSVQSWGRFLELAPASWMSGQRSVSKSWGCKGTYVATKAEMGSGRTNTELIVSACSELDTAARVVSDLAINGFDDWFLPSKDELSALISSQKWTGLYIGYDYWTSSQATEPLGSSYLSQYAWACRTAYNECTQNMKTSLGWGGLGVIPIRAFS